MRWFRQTAINVIIDWLSKEVALPISLQCDFNRLCCELQAGDVLLVEGHSRISSVIKTITQSTWTHSALFIGHVSDIQDPVLQQWVRNTYHGNLDEPLLLEALFGHGTILVPVSKYRRHHVRICRPTGLQPEDRQRVVAHAINHLGTDYDTRHLLDLARFFLPWSILPRRLGSSLFDNNAAIPTRTICSSLIASAFNSVDFPIIPPIKHHGDGSVRFFKRNPRLFSPRDFDKSPYFEIKKYPYMGNDDLGGYRHLPWCEEKILYNDDVSASAATYQSAKQKPLSRRLNLPRKTKKRSNLETMVTEETFRTFSQPIARKTDT
jgi:hypothetical protein